MKCPLCKSLLTQKIDPSYYDCEECKSLVKDPSLYLQAAEEKAFYLLHNNDVNDKGYQQFTSPITNYIMEKYQPTAKGLDFGSGTGPVITKMLKDQQFNNISLYDPYFHSDEKALSTLYDFIYSCEVVEHFHQPQKEYERLVSLLKPGGRLLIMTHPYNGEIPFENWYYRKDPTHVFIHRKETFAFIANYFGVELEFQGERLVVLRNP